MDWFTLRLFALKVWPFPKSRVVFTPLVVVFWSLMRKYSMVRFLLPVAKLVTWYTSAPVPASMIELGACARPLYTNFLLWLFFTMFRRFPVGLYVYSYRSVPMVASMSR